MQFVSFLFLCQCCQCDQMLYHISCQLIILCPLFMVYVNREVDELQTELRKYLHCGQEASSSVSITNELLG